MKNAFTIAFGITALVLIACIVKVSKNDKKIAKPILKVLAVAAIAVVLRMVLVCSEVEILSRVMYSMYFTAIDWLVYFFLFFVCGMRTKNQKNI